MNNKRVTLSIIIISILLVSLYVISNTYAVIIDVIEDQNGNELINMITIRDLLTDNNGEYNETYYEVKKELNITTEEANLLMDSVSLNNGLQMVINNIVAYKLHSEKRMTKSELSELIQKYTNQDNSINDELKNKIFNKSSEYINDIYNYLYDIKVSSNGEKI